MANMFKKTPTSNNSSPASIKKSNATPFESLSANVTGLGSRLRVIEERYSNIRKKTQMTDENLLDFERDIRSEIQSLNQDVLDIKSSLNELKEKILSISSELKGTVHEHDLKVLERYVEMWEPLNFITKEEAKELIDKINKL